MCLGSSHAVLSPVPHPFCCPNMSESASTPVTAPCDCSSPHRRIFLYVTGFGVFRGVAENPTSLLIPLLHAALAAVTPSSLPAGVCLCGHPCSCPQPTHVLLRDARVMEVSAVAADTCLRELHGMAVRCSPHIDLHVFLHFGVAAGARTLSLERCAYNDATFRVPDERGEQPIGQCVDTGVPWGEKEYTTMPVDALVAALQSKGHAVQASTDPGRFLCNYAYYASLRLAKGDDCKCVLFIHTPSYSRDTIHALVDFAIDAILAISDAAQVGKEAYVAWVGSSVTAPAAGSGEDADAAAKDGVVPGVHSELVGMGFTSAQAAAALAGTSGGDLESCVEWIVRQQEEATAPAASGAPTLTAEQEAMLRMLLPAAAAASVVPRKEYKMVIVVRDDLGMGKGKIAAQTCHAALAAQRAIMRSSDGGKAQVYKEWRATGEPIVVLRCADLAAMQAIAAAARVSGLDTFPIRDAGRTQVEPGTMTVMAIGPAAVETIDSVTGSLKLL